MKKMKIAIFGRTIDEGSLKELSIFFNAIKKVNEVELFVYKPFKDYLFSQFSTLSQFGPIGEAIKNASEFSLSSELPSSSDLFISLGGDGTFLSAVPLIRDKEIPIAGVNFGRLGFLTLAKGEREDLLNHLFKGNFKTEYRSLIEVDCDQMPGDFYPCALNEFALQRVGPAVLELHIKINDTPVPHYMADGVLVASATGSTAYSLSAGGPIVMPECSDLILVPIAPHNLNVRPLVIPDSSLVEIAFTTRYHQAMLTADNRSFNVANNSTIRFFKSKNKLRIVTPETSFMKALSEKLFWGADWRNL